MQKQPKNTFIKSTPGDLCRGQYTEFSVLGSGDLRNPSWTWYISSWGTLYHYTV